jgi:hypothetical protein
MSMINWRMAAVAGVVGVLAGMGRAQPAIDVGETTLGVGAAETVEVYVTGGQDVEGMNFLAQIADGVSGPVFVDANVLDGTIFQANHDYWSEISYVSGRYVYQAVTTDAGAVQADGLIATLTVDTRGWRGDFGLSLTSEAELGAATDFTSYVVPAITDGVLHVVPTGGDATLDGLVDVTDLAILAANWRGQGLAFEQGDFDESGLVDVTDLAILAANWGAGAKPAPIPEPMTLSLVAAGVLAACRRR